MDQTITFRQILVNQCIHSESHLTIQSHRQVFFFHITSLNPHFNLSQEFVWTEFQNCLSLISQKKLCFFLSHTTHNFPASVAFLLYILVFFCNRIPVHTNWLTQTKSQLLQIPTFVAYGIPSMWNTISHVAFNSKD